MQPSGALRIRYRQSVMPLDDLSLDLTPRAAEPAPAVEVMTRVLRLPTGSPRQARAMVRLQLDRLSPVPSSSVAYDLAMLRREGSETVYALGIVRRSAIENGAPTTRGILQVSQEIEGVDVVFRFRDPDAAGDLETRWLKHAPKAAVLALGVAAIMLAGNLRTEQWRERRLPEIATAQRLAAREAIAQRETAEALKAWTDLTRADAATRFLCVGDVIGSVRPGGIRATNLSADSRHVMLTVNTGDATALRNQGGDPVPSNGVTTQVVFPETVCG